MTRSIRIAPSILSADFSKLGEEIRAIDAAGADYIHVDVMDGHFVPNITFGPMVMKSVRGASKKIFDVHLMISPVDPYIQAFADGGADIITIHPEAGAHWHRTLQAIRGMFTARGLDLWDIKIEWGLDANGAPLLIDEVSPGCCRAFKAGTKERVTGNDLAAYFQK